MRAALLFKSLLHLTQCLSRKSSWGRWRTSESSFTKMAAPRSLVLATISTLLVVIDAIPPSTDHGIMSIKNNLPYPITIICNSNTEIRPPFYAPPNRSLQFDFDTRRHLAWTCTFQSEGPDGTFILWKSRAVGGPGSLCLEVCQWRAEAQGLKVLRNGTGHTVLVYVWH